MRQMKAIRNASSSTAQKIVDKQHEERQRKYIAEKRRQLSILLHT